MTCEYLDNGICRLASKLSDTTAQTNEQACSICLSCETRYNRVTASLALGNIPRPIPQRYHYLYGLLKTTRSGIGSELAAILKWFPKKVDDCDCDIRIAKMNVWGPAKCRENMDTILRWLRHSAHTNGIPFNRTATRLVVERVIHNHVRKSICNQPATPQGSS